MTVVDAGELQASWQPQRLPHFAIEKVQPYPQEPTPLDDTDAGAVEVITQQTSKSADRGRLALSR